MDRQLLQQYAEFAVKAAVNLQKGQTLMINCPIEVAFFGRACAEVGYQAGAREVVIHYNDEKLGRIRMEHTALEVLEDVKPWRLRSRLDYVEGEGGACILHIVARNPEIFKGLDTGKIEKANQAVSKAMKPWQELTMSNKVQWSIVAVPSEAWAEKVFAGEKGEQAIEKLWKTIFEVSRVAGGDPVQAWRDHVNNLNAKRDWLQSLNLSALRLKSSNGTDLEVGLADDHVWLCAEEKSAAGVSFLANVPTEEVFTAPHMHRTNGVFKSSLPYVYNGNLIEGMSVTFKDGLAVEYTAEKGEDLLVQMLSSDEGARRIGEMALVPASSPIRQTGLLFYNTLFDENAACHIAFGAGYPTTVEGGGGMSREQLLEKGLNDSLVHEDVMIGTPDMEIVGITKEGKEVPIFKNGGWA